MPKRKTARSRGMRDEAGVGPNPRDARRLVPMRELGDYKLVDGEPDIRGWNVYTATGRELGDVQDLLVDPDMGEVVMLDVDLKRDDRHTLAPISRLKSVASIAVAWPIPRGGEFSTRNSGTSASGSSNKAT